MTQGKTYLGKPHQMSEVDGWIKVGSWFDVKENNLEWIMFEKKQEHSPTWKTYKVVANGRAKQKANYWFAYDVPNKKIGFAKDLAFMLSHRPALYIYVLEVLEG